MADDDDERRLRALRDIRYLGDGVLAHFQEDRWSGGIEYKLESRFVSAVGSFSYTTGKAAPPLIRVQYPLWEHLTDEERAMVVAHEHAHFVQFIKWNEADHGPSWVHLMEKIGYQTPKGVVVLNPRAREYLRVKKMANERATIWVKDGWIVIRTPFNRDFVNELKADFPPSQRKFDPNEKVWKVAAAYADDVMSVVTKYFGEPAILEQEVRVVAAPISAEDPYSTLLQAAPDEVLKKIYLLIVSKVHPDAGGSNEKMATVNAAWGEIKKERKL